MKKKLFSFLIANAFWGICFGQSNNGLLYGNDAYSVFTDKVVQGEYISRIISTDEIRSNYRSPEDVSNAENPHMVFKFCINGGDNENHGGYDHTFNILSLTGKDETPVFRFGELYIDKREIPDDFVIVPNTRLKIRLDMNHVLRSFDEKGYYITPRGNKIMKEDFKSVYIAGNIEPLTWNFGRLKNRPDLELKDDDGDGIYEIELIMNNQDKKRVTCSWKKKKEVDRYPRFTSDILISDAIYNMSVEEATNLIEADNTWRTGESWGGVWTRDISYSILLSMSYMRPDISMNSLMRKVKDGRIVQDTGTGGSYPVSSDRIIWAVAAWQIYLVTGDKDWLAKSYEIIKNTILQDEQIVFDTETGLVRGESSFLDWREQEYPRWMQPADIYESECLGTNAAFYRANEIAAEMASLTGDKALVPHFKENAERIKKGINRYLWMPDRGYYGQYLYGRNAKILSPRSETLGESLCVLFDIADQEQSEKIVRSVVHTPFGNTCLFPQIPNMTPYHNNGIWPFVQTYWTWAAAKAGNEPAVTAGIAAVYRAAALFATNKENFVAENGDFKTEMNSSNMLWSISGSLGIVHRLFFGINFEKDYLAFRPFIPKALAGKKKLENFKYRNATLDIEISGYGDELDSFTIDGKKNDPIITPKLKGRHKIVMVMKNNTPKSQYFNDKPNYTSVETPKGYLSAINELAWVEAADAVSYKIIKDGKEIAHVNDASINGSRFRIGDPGMYTEYQFIGVDKKGYEGFASEPLPVYDPKYETIVYVSEFAPVTDFKKCRKFTGNGAVEISKTENREIVMMVDVPETGEYIFDFRYANGSNTLIEDNKCAMRTLSVDGEKRGTVVFPQRGRDMWSEWGFSNQVRTGLEKGKRTVVLSFEDFNENMNGNVNRAMLDYMRIIRVK